MKNFKKARNILFCLILTGFFVSSCKNTGKGIQKDYKQNKEKVGEKVEDAGENMQDE